MPSRHRSRERALQMIFQWDSSRAPTDKVREAYWGNLSSETGTAPSGGDDAFSNRLLEGVAENIDHIDELIQRHAANWRLERMSAVDRNILRMAVYELLEESAAPAVIINEALEIGRRFSGEESAPFLNGVLDAVRKALEASKPAAANSQTSP